ncbi:hypothetical protein NKH18_23600 [Streptomyces sp. M10(2022)]
MTAAALVYTAAEGRGGTPHASADPSPSIWQDDRPRADTTPVATTSPPRVDRPTSRSVTRPATAAPSSRSPRSGRPSRSTWPAR